MVRWKTFREGFFVAGDAPFDLEELRRSQTLSLASGHQVWVKSPEDTVLRKLEWYRMGGETSDRQWGDLRGLIATQRERLDGPYLFKWAEVLGVTDLLRLLLDQEP